MPATLAPAAEEGRLLLLARHTVPALGLARGHAALFLFGEDGPRVVRMANTTTTAPADAALCRAALLGVWTGELQVVVESQSTAPLQRAALR
jgi:hypothetical protein